MGLQPLAYMAILDLILHITGNDAAEEKKKPRIAGIQERKALPGMLVFQQVQGDFPRYEFMSEYFIIAPGEEMDAGKDHYQVAGKGGDLAAGHFGHRNRQ